MDLRMSVRPLPADFSLEQGIKQVEKMDTNFKDLLATFKSAGQPEDALEAYVKMTPAQRMRMAVLESMGLEEGDLEAMGPEERKAIEEQIANAIKREMEETATTKGSRIDITV